MRSLPRLALALPLALLWPACGGGAADPTPCTTSADCAPSLGITCTKIGACCIQTGGDCTTDADCSTGERCSPTRHLCGTDPCTQNADCPSGKRCANYA